MTHFQQIYSHRAADYHRLIAAEDKHGHLLPALEKVTSLRGKRILDLGTGTGRLPLLVAKQAASMVCLDLYDNMLRENQRQRAQVGGAWSLLQGDMQTLPLRDASFDIVTAGWAIGHSRTWHADNWRVVIAQVLQEMQRVATHDGALIIMETLTTGSLKPAPPTRELAEYYAWLESEWGFRRQVIRTDYHFANIEDAVAKTEFFFGKELSQAIEQNHWVQLPEWTGVWSRVGGG